VWARSRLTQLGNQLHPADLRSKLNSAPLMRSLDPLRCHLLSLGADIERREFAGLLCGRASMSYQWWGASVFVTRGRRDGVVAVLLCTGVPGTLINKLAPNSNVIGTDCFVYVKKYLNRAPSGQVVGPAQGGFAPPSCARFVVQSSQCSHPAA